LIHNAEKLFSIDEIVEDVSREGFFKVLNDINIITSINYYLAYIVLIFSFIIITIIIINNFKQIKKTTIKKSKELFIILLISISTYIYAIKNCIFAVIHQQTFGFFQFKALFYGLINPRYAHYGNGQEVLFHTFKFLFSNYKAIFYMNLILYIIGGILLTLFISKLLKKPFQKTILILYLFCPLTLRFATTETFYFSWMLYFSIFMLSLHYFFKTNNKLYLILSLLTATLVIHTGPFSFLTIILGSLIYLILFFKKCLTLLKKPFIYTLFFIGFLFNIFQLIAFKIILNERLITNNYEFITIQIESFFVKLFFFDLNISPLIYFILISVGVILPIILLLKYFIKNKTKNNLIEKHHTISKNHYKNNYIIYSISMLSIIVISYFIFGHIQPRGIINDFKKEILLLPFFLLLINIGILFTETFFEKIFLENKKKYKKILPFFLRSIIIISLFIGLFSTHAFYSFPTLNQQQFLFIEENIPLFKDRPILYFRTRHPEYSTILSFFDNDMMKKEHLDIKTPNEFDEKFKDKNIVFFKGNICHYNLKFADSSNYHIIKYFCNNFSKKLKPIKEQKLDFKQYNDYNNKKYLTSSLKDIILTKDSMFVFSENLVIDSGMIRPSKENIDEYEMGFYVFNNSLD
jgi:hypothetical protein